MIVKTNILDVGILESLRNQMDTDIISQNWRIKKHKSGNYLIIEQIGTCNWFSDKVNFVESFFDKIYNREFNSILCGGLGLGVVPYLVQSFCDKIDVVEISQSNIDLIRNNTNYLDSKVNIIQGDIRIYDTTEKYDVVLIDIWTCDLNAFESEKNGIINKFSQNINPNGLILLPLEGYYVQRNLT